MSRYKGKSLEEITRELSEFVVLFDAVIDVTMESEKIISYCQLSKAITPIRNQLEVVSLELQEFWEEHTYVDFNNDHQ